MIIIIIIIIIIMSQYKPPDVSLPHTLSLHHSAINMLSLGSDASMGLRPYYANITVTRVVSYKIFYEIYEKVAHCILKKAQDIPVNYISHTVITCTLL
jgi:hypothetical protein